MFKPASITVITALLALINFVMPTMALRSLVRLVTGQSAAASLVTTRLITSPATVAAALTMAADEMLTIKQLDEDCRLWRSRRSEPYLELTPKQSCLNRDTKLSSTLQTVIPMAGLAVQSVSLRLQRPWTKARLWKTSGSVGTFVIEACLMHFASSTRQPWHTIAQSGLRQISRRVCQPTEDERPAAFSASLCIRKCQREAFTKQNLLFPKTGREAHELLLC